MDITVRWAGASDATAASVYKVERSVDWSTWTQVAAAQAATSPYATKQNTLANNTSFGAASIVLVSGTAFSSSGYGSMGDAYFTWAGKTSETLTGVVWILGSGIYASATIVYQLHESFADTNVTITAMAAVYRITHIVSDVSAPPDYIWFYSPGAPASSEHCRVMVGVFADVGLEPLDGIPVICRLSGEGDFTAVGNFYVDPNTSSVNTQMTNALGLVAFDCWHNASRFAMDGVVAAYTFIINATAAYTISVGNIEARQMMFLGQLVN